MELRPYEMTPTADKHVKVDSASRAGCFWTAGDTRMFSERAAAEFSTLFVMDNVAAS